ncbi:MAG: iron export ABC transporter permease subunit FetB [Gammaproteobacteria bacterium]|nr:iron export ABC transporter permease subunit FetB [Gammaproteobacteria bacterium]
MSVIHLSPWDLMLAATTVLALAAISLRMQLGVTQTILIAAVRTVLQLGLIGLVLKLLFESLHPLWLVPLAMVMLAAAGREVMSRQKRRLRGLQGWLLGTGAMFVSSFLLTVFALTVVIGVEPWYKPQYAIPLLGMMLGNTMTGIAVGMDRLQNAVVDLRPQIEQRLMLGQTAADAIRPQLKEAARAGMIPMINAMAAAGIVSLPGMMTGQILAGSPPLEAVSYQILIMFIVSAGTGFGTLLALHWVAKSLFDERDRLRLDRLQ